MSEDIATITKIDIHFEGRSLWEIKGHIKQSQTEDVGEYYYIKSGYQDKSLAKIHLLTINRATKRCKYKIIQDTERSYDVGRIQDNQDIPKLYPINEHNTKIFDILPQYENKISDIKNKQKELVKELKK